MGSVTGGGMYKLNDVVTLTATPESGYDFHKWSDGNMENPRTITVLESTTLTAEYVLTNSPVDGYEQGYGYIDLRLPSGTLWASYNVGAIKPEDYGDHFAWGETTTKEIYDWSTYTYGNSTSQLTKYCIISSYGKDGFTDNKTVLEATDDAATANWGGTWRMPTKAEQDELRTECTWAWTTLNGVNGYRVMGPNGKSIFLPAAGYRLDTSLYDAGSYGYYWSSSLFSDNLSNAYGLYFSGGNRGTSSYYRYYGLSVRSVCSPQ